MIGMQMMMTRCANVNVSTVFRNAGVVNCCVESMMVLRASGDRTSIMMMKKVMEQTSVTTRPKTSLWSSRVPTVS